MMPTAEPPNGLDCGPTTERTPSRKATGSCLEVAKRRARSQASSEPCSKAAWAASAPASREPVSSLKPTPARMCRALGDIPASFVTCERPPPALKALKRLLLVYRVAPLTRQLCAHSRDRRHGRGPAATGLRQ